jgi:hypothetical protein
MSKSVNRINICENITKNPFAVHVFNTKPKPGRKDGGCDVQVEEERNPGAEIANPINVKLDDPADYVG